MTDDELARYKSLLLELLALVPKDEPKGLLILNVSRWILGRVPASFEAHIAGLLERCDEMEVERFAVRARSIDFGVLAGGLRPGNNRGEVASDERGDCGVVRTSHSAVGRNPRCEDRIADPTPHEQSRRILKWIERSFG